MKVRNHEIPAVCRQTRRTISDLFCETYVESDAAASYILLPGILVSREYADHPERVLGPEGNPKRLITRNGVPAYRIRHKLHNAMRFRGFHVMGLYGDLAAIFTDAAIKELFKSPDIWLLNHNERARKRNATEEAAVNHARKLDPSGAVLHTECASRTRNSSVSAATRYERKLSNQP